MRDHEAIRLKSAARKQREAEVAAARAALAAREAKIQKSLKAPTLEERYFDDLLKSERDASFRDFLRVVNEKAPRLVGWKSQAMVGTLRSLTQLPTIRDVSTWEPKGKGEEALFRSLCDHLFAQYPTPPFLWSVFQDAVLTDKCGLFVAFVASGGSVYEGVQTHLLPVPLTRKMCHDFMQTPANVPFLKAVRRVQVRACGGDPRLLTAWMGSSMGSLRTKQEEDFWVTVLEWLAKNPMMDMGKVAPLIDYIQYRRRVDANFSMKGRAVLALLRGMDEWHGELAKQKASGTTFKPTGFKELKTVKAYKQDGYDVEETWTVEELLSSKALQEEGRILAHCVFSYESSVTRGTTSIWSMSMAVHGNKKKQMTIELRNDIMRVVQFRGKYNRKASVQEMQILHEWAHLNNLSIQLGQW